MQPLSEDLINSLFTKNALALEELNKEIRSLKNMNKTAKDAAAGNAGKQPNIDTHELNTQNNTQLAQQLKLQLTKIFSEHENRLVKLILKQPTPKKTRLYVGLSFLAAFMINIASVYLICHKQQLVLSDEHYRIYTFGKKMQTVWGKLNKDEKAKLVKLMD